MINFTKVLKFILSSGVTLVVTEVELSFYSRKIQKYSRMSTIFFGNTRDKVIILTSFITEVCVPLIILEFEEWIEV